MTAAGSSCALTDSTVDADRSASLLRVFDLDRHAPDALNFERPGFGVLHRAAALEARVYAPKDIEGLTHSLDQRLPWK